MSLTGILLPRLGDRSSYRRLYEIWRVGYEQAHPVPKIENVQYVHDPQWKDRVFSITNARERRSPVWRVVEILFVISQLGLGFGTWLVIRVKLGLAAYGLIVTAVMGYLWHTRWRQAVENWRFDHAIKAH